MCHGRIGLKKHKKITVSCVYRTPGSDLDLFCESIEHIFTDVMPRKSMFICGDFNIDLTKYETHNGTKRFFRLYVWSRVASVNRLTESNYYPFVYFDR